MRQSEKSDASFFYFQLKISKIYPLFSKKQYLYSKDSEKNESSSNLLILSCVIEELNIKNFILE